MDNEKKVLLMRATISLAQNFDYFFIIFLSHNYIILFVLANLRKSISTANGDDSVLNEKRKKKQFLI